MYIRGRSLGWTGIQAPGLASMAAAPRAGKAGQGSKLRNLAKELPKGKDNNLPNNPNPNQLP